MRLIDGDELLTAFPVDDEPTLTKACVRMTIQHMPTIEPMRGKWIDKSGGIEDAWNYCSVCGEQAIDLYDFCPNCGADMREGGEDEQTD